MDDALAREEARQLELALAASLADQGTPPQPPPNLNPQSWGNVGGLPPSSQAGSSHKHTPPPKASSSVGGPEGLAFIPGFGNILDRGTKKSPKLLQSEAGSSSTGAKAAASGSNGAVSNVNSIAVGTVNGDQGPRQRRQGVYGGSAVNGELGNGGKGVHSQDEQDRQLAMKLAAEENRRGPRSSEEERDRQLALKLQEEEARSVEVVAHPSPIWSPPSDVSQSHPPSDEEFARNLQEQLALEDRLASGGMPPGAPSGGANGAAPRGGFRLPLGGSLGSVPQIPAPLRTLGQRLSNLGPASAQTICTRCKQPIIAGRFFTAGDQTWHGACLLCTTCGEHITSNARVHQGKTYHDQCYLRHIHPRCSVCRMPIPANEHRIIEFVSHPFWRDKHCPSHEHDGTARCCACDRLEPVDTQYVTLDDGRRLCLECCSSVVVDTADCQPLYREVLEFYETMGMRLRQKDIPLLLVERQALNEAKEKEHSSSHDAMTTRGLCLSEEQVITSVVRKPAGRFHSHQGLSHETEERVLRRHCEVTAILILFGLPRLLTGSILAHELMHAWLRLDGSFPRLEAVIEEGICQVLAHMWLQTQLPARSPNETRPTQTFAGAPGVHFRISDGDSVKTEEEVSERLAELFLHEIAMNPTAVYGAGFRAGHTAVVKFGLETVLEHVRMTGTFPA